MAFDSNNFNNIDANNTALKISTEQQISQNTRKVNDMNLTLNISTICAVTQNESTHLGA